MEKTLFLAIDLGTSFIKAGVYDATGNLVVQASEPVKDSRPEPGVFIQRGDDLFQSVVNCIKQVTAQLQDRSNQIEAISFTGQMAGFMGVDKDWNDITTWSCSLDSRYMPYAEKQMAEMKDLFLNTAGTNFPQMAPKVAWFKAEFPEEAKKIEKYLMISGYVLGRLGDIPVSEATIDRSFTEWTGLSEVNFDRWSPEITGRIGLDMKYLPRIVNSSTICAHLNQTMAKELGLKAGIPLVSGAGDKAAGALGAGIVNYGDTIFEASSYGAISTCVPEYRPDALDGRLDVVPSAIPGDFYMMHYIAGSGITLDWFMNTFVKSEGMSTKEVFADIEKKMESIKPGCNGLMAIGLLGGNSMPSDGVLRGMWMGFDWSHKKEHFYKALLESYTYDFALCLESIDRLFPEYAIDKIKIIGGGAKSPFWTQMCADVQNKTYQLINREDVALWGASIIAGNAIGLFPDMKQTALDHIKVTKEVLPNREEGLKHAKNMDLYKKYVIELHDFYKRLQDIAQE